MFDGYSVTPLTWGHPDSDGDRVYAVAYRPEPLPEGPLPLLLNVHGHWGGGVEVDEVHRRAVLFAQQGWLVLSVANRGDEHGVATPRWRRSHHMPAAYALARIRRSGGAPLTWDVAAARSGLDLALTGRLGASVDRDRIATIGFSGGAERAAVLGAVDPRIGAVVLGAYEYAFSSGHGMAGCTCGSVRGAAEPLRDHAYTSREMPESAAGYAAPVQGWRWLALAACRPGAPVAARPVLAWDNMPDDVVDLELSAVGTVERRALGGHGIPPAVMAASATWLDEAFGMGGASSEAAMIARADAGLSPFHDRWRTPLPPTLPAPGEKEQGAPPWRADVALRPDALLGSLGLRGAADPGDALRVHEGRVLTVSAPAGDPAAAWLVVTGGTPGPIPADLTESDAIPWISGDAQLAALGGIAALGLEGAVARLDLRVGRTAERDVGLSAWGAELGVPALGVAVADVLAAHRVLREHPGVDAARIGLVGVGPAGVAALHAAVLLGGGPVRLVDAPVTLWFGGPDSGGPFYPWPAWTLAPVPAGASLDPWLAAASLGDRVRWLRPRGGDGAVWTEHLPHGVTVDDVAALFAGGP